MADEPSKPDVDEPQAERSEPAPDYVRPTMPFERKASIDTSVGRWSAVGFEFCIYVGLFFLGGLWLDGKLDTRPWAAAIGALLGVAIAMYMLIRRVTGFSSPTAGDEKGQGSGPRPKG